ncbi:hypothetical protein SAMN04487972_11064 [Paracoccus halophilus]|uniref:Anti-sigma factor n=1 Tax=Paracoccus halophilus TaxID=376733 RepID=A0A099EXG3_9RHOB|nr:hypothetical protein [Paracoccus halophilus]KGJ03105.1 hypothetical protein IT41_15455 [Paracoccus halophilus]SFA52996.1 hypothetical protein SAMN04487972_11064 [Paracoccus halophilus]
MQISDETLMALADGELDPAAAGDIQKAVAADPLLAARYERFVRTRQILAEAARARPAIGGEDPLAAMIRAGSLRPAPLSQPANLNRRPLLAAAASVALAVVGLGWWLWPDAGPAAIPAAELAALESLPSGETRALEDGAELTMIASFTTEQGQFCREYETLRDARIRIVLACREAEGWQGRFAAVIEGEQSGYVPASGDVSLEAALRDLGAGAPLTPAEEASALGIDARG